MESSELKPTLSLNDAVKINEAAKLMGCTVESLLIEAANSERLLYVAIKPHSSTLAAIPSHPTPREGTHTTKAHSIVAMLPVYAESLAIAGSAEITQYQAGFEAPLDWHYWILDEHQTVSLDSVYVPRHNSMLNDGTGSHAETEPKERELTAWLRETWINEGKLGGTAFFTRLKKYEKQTGSPIVEHYSAGKNAGFRWETSAGTTGRMTKKTIQSKVSIFNNKPQQNTVNSKK